MAIQQISTRARVRNTPAISQTLQWLGAVALALMLAVAAAPARGDTITNRIYPSDPTQWTLIGGAAKYSNKTIAPDSSLIVPIQGAAGVLSGVAANHPVPVGAGEVHTFSVYYRYIAGVSPAARLCMNGDLLGQATDQCLLFNPRRGFVAARDPGIIDYTIAPVQPDGWLRVSIVFKTAVGGLAKPSITGFNGQIFGVWGAQFESGPYPGQMIPTIAGPASGTNQILASPDSPSRWTCFQPPLIQVAGRGSDAVHPYWSMKYYQSCAIPVSGIVSGTQYYIYAYYRQSPAPQAISRGATLMIQFPNQAAPGIMNRFRIDVDLVNGKVANAVASSFSSSTGPIIDFSSGVIDAGTDWIVWINRIFSFTDETSSLSVYPYETGPQSAYDAIIGRVGLQQGGIFP